MTVIEYYWLQCFDTLDLVGRRHTQSIKNVWYIFARVLFGNKYRKKNQGVGLMWDWQTTDRRDNLVSSP